MKWSTALAVPAAAFFLALLTIYTRNYELLPELRGEGWQAPDEPEPERPPSRAPHQAARLRHRP